MNLKYCFEILFSMKINSDGTIFHGSIWIWSVWTMKYEIRINLTVVTRDDKVCFKCQSSNTKRIDGAKSNNHHGNIESFLINLCFALDRFIWYFIPMPFYNDISNDGNVREQWGKKMHTIECGPPVHLLYSWKKRGKKNNIQQKERIIEVLEEMRINQIWMERVIFANLKAISWAFGAYIFVVLTLPKEKHGKKKQKLWIDAYVKWTGHWMSINQFYSDAVFENWK